MKENVKRVPKKLIDFTINTENNIDEQIEKIANKLKEENNL